MIYLARHWRGDLTLAVSFWINFVALTALLFAALPLIQLQLAALSFDDDPRLMSRIALVHLLFLYLVLYPWQVVGVWRAAGRAGRRRFLGVAARVAVLVSVSVSVVTVVNGSLAYRDILQIALWPDRYGDFSVRTVGEGGRLLHFQGYLGYGSAREVRRAMAREPGTVGIILDSPGGWIAAGRSLSRVIEDHGLDTFSFEGCHSACATAFMAGRNRFLADEARLGFHQYEVPFSGLAGYSDMRLEQQRDLQHFHSRGVRPEFLNRLFQAAHDEVWLPSQRELLAARAITGVVRSEEVLFGVHADIGNAER